MLDFILDVAMLREIRSFDEVVGRDNEGRYGRVLIPRKFSKTPHLARDSTVYVDIGIYKDTVLPSSNTVL